MKATQIDHALDGTLTPEMEFVSRIENMDEETVISRVADGSLVIMKRDNGRCVAIGKGATTKVNVNLGTSSDTIHPGEEIEKAHIAEKYGADTITDLSMGGDISAIRKSIFENTSLPITTVPIYQAVVEKGLMDMDTDDILSYLKTQVDEGVNSVVLHCVQKKMLERLKSSGRVMGMVSKGGSFTSVFMLSNKCENPFLEHFEEVMEIMRKKDVVLSLGNTMRSGCIHDLWDEAHKMEAESNVRLAHKAHENGVQVIIEGMGGHIQANNIAERVKFYKSRSDFPLFVAGPLPTDIAVGYDHIAGAVGASMASGAGADYLCYITPAEHLSLPSPEQVREGLVAFKIASHIGDSIKYGISCRDLELARKRVRFDWEGQMEFALDPDKPRTMCPDNPGPCTMCGKYCAISIMSNYLTGNK
jgi:phosphomethylpyrimidine synthase